MKSIVNTGEGMKIRNQPYLISGIILILAGLVITPLFYFGKGNVPMAAAGTSAAILGITVFFLGRTRTSISGEYLQSVLEAYRTNTAALLTLHEATGKAVYQPAGKKGEAPKVVIQTNKGMVEMAVPGLSGVSMAEHLLGPGGEEMENAARYLITGVYEIARSVNLSQKDREIRIEIGHSELKDEAGPGMPDTGSAAAAIAAAVVCTALKKPVRIKQDTWLKAKEVVIIEALD